jgi:DNA-binding response OmpR family regulator
MIVMMTDNNSSQAQWGAGSPPRVAPASRILVVDDESTIRLLIAHILSHAGYQVDTAEDGEMGWEALQAESYQLLITDHNMPKVSGLELVRKMQAQDMALPVILISGAMPTEELNRHSWLQLSAMLPKPFTGDKLLRIVKKVLGEVQSARQQGDPVPDDRGEPTVHGLLA